jgi:hypothetical protein
VPVAVLPPRPCSLCRTGWDGARWYPVVPDEACPLHTPLRHLSDRDSGQAADDEFPDPNRAMAAVPVCAAGCGRPVAVNLRTRKPTRYCSRRCNRRANEAAARARRRARAP